MPLKQVPQSGSPVFQSGKLRHRIQIVQPTLAQDTAGGWNVNTNNVVLTCWATIEALTGVEKFAAHEFTSNVTHSVWIRHPRSAVPGGIQAKMQVWFNTRQLQVESVLDPDGRQKYLQLLCIEVGDSQQQATASPSESTI
jgi:SPP1 family predicted phage head-tail adaptor